MKNKKQWPLFLGLFVSLLVIAGCSSKVKINKEAYSDRQYMMGTYVNIQIFDNDKEAVLKDAFAKVEDLAARITVDDPGSEIDKINQAAGLEPVKVSPDIYELVKSALDYSESSKGGFDMTIGPITQLWHIGFDDARKPAQSEIDETLKLVDYHKVKLDDEKQTVFLEEKGMRLDLGAIAKGFITDEVAKVLKENDVTTAIIDLGGNIYVMGDSPKSAKGSWNVGIQDPNQTRNKTVGSLPAKNQSLVTSGIYERNLTVDGETYHHLFNSKTGYPFVNDIAGVTIISDQSIDGDGLSTAVFSMGVKEGMAYVEGLKNTETIFVTRDDKVYVSSGLKDSFKLNEESGYTVEDIKNLK